MMAKHELLQAMAQPVSHMVAAKRVSADAASWRTLKWFVVRIADGLGLTRAEFESTVRSAAEQSAW
jgi:hypothetical protein